MSKYLKFPKLYEAGEKKLDITFQKLGKYLESFAENKTLKITIVDSEERKNNFVSFGKGKSEISQRSEKEDDLEVMIKLENWWKIASGEKSPIDLFLEGKIGMKGDMHLASAILKQIGTSGQKYTFCGDE